MPRSHVVTSADTAIALGSGDVRVLATPRLIAWLEAATVDACPELGPEETSVGTRVDIEHLAATPLGARVDARAEVVHRDGRLLRFSVTAHHDAGSGSVLIAQGQVTRVVVRREPFLARTAPSLLIREALPEELPAVGELRVESYIAGYGMATEEVGYAAVLRDAPGHAAHADVLVALRDGELVGTVAIARAGSPLAEVAQPGEVLVEHRRRHLVVALALQDQHRLRHRARDGRRVIAAEIKPVRGRCAHDHPGLRGIGRGEATD